MRGAFFGTLAFLAASGQAHAATAIILNAGNTALPSYTTAQVFQTFGTNIPNGSVFKPNTTITNPLNSGSPFESVDNPNYYGANSRVVVNGTSLSGMTGNYLSIASGGAYTIDFSQPVAFFSFAFHEIESNHQLTLTFSNNKTQVLSGLNIIGSPKKEPEFGRVSFDVGSGSKIKSVTFSTGAYGDDDDDDYEDVRDGYRYKDDDRDDDDYEDDDDYKYNAFTIDSIASAAPEPSAWALMILGFGLIGAQLRRLKRRVPVAS